MRWTEGFIAVDWGTSNRRAYRVGSDGVRSDEIEDKKGVLSIRAGGFPEAAAEIRSRLGEYPMLMAGMVGSNRGWTETGYVDAPAGAEAIAAGVSWVESDRVAILPGVAWRAGEAADVMRGEEVQIVGAVAAGLVPHDAVICQPGTHNKWVEVVDGRIAAFRTVMTGELFNLLKEHSILADLMVGPVDVGEAFDSGVRYGLDHDDFAAQLFAVRARFLLGKTSRAEAGPYVSGLLIGSDLRIGLRGAEEGEIVVMGRKELTNLYGRALTVAGRGVREIDGETAFVAGATRLAELIA